MTGAGSIITQRWNRLPQGLRFCIIGGWNTLFGVGCFAALHLSLGERIHYLVLLIVASELAILNAYIAHKLAVFNDHPRIELGEVARFHSVYLVSAVIGLVATWGLVEWLGMHPIAAQAMTTAFTVAISFYAHKRFSFARKADPPAT